MVYSSVELEGNNVEGEVEVDFVGEEDRGGMEVGTGVGVGTGRVTVGDGESTLGSAEVGVAGLMKAPPSEVIQ